MLKYIKIIASSNFGNIFSIIHVSVFSPFLPMTSTQTLLLNLPYDILCIVLPWDNVDEEEALSPRDWLDRTLGWFMMSFGPLSSLFDITIFLFLCYFLYPISCGGATYLNITDPPLQLQYVSLSQTEWFLESMWVQALALYFLRISKVPFMQSRAPTPVICITLAGTVAFTAMTSTSGAPLPGVTRLPPWYFAFLLFVALTYIPLTMVAKYLHKKYYELIRKEEFIVEKSINYIPMDSILEIWLLEKLIKEPPKNDCAEDFLSGIRDMINGEVPPLISGASEKTKLSTSTLSDRIIVGELEIYSKGREVLQKGLEISLAPKEFDILYFLTQNRDKVFTKEQTYRVVWGDDYPLDGSNIMAFIRKLHKKIEPDSDAPKYISTIWGIGHKFDNQL